MQHEWQVDESEPSQENDEMLQIAQNIDAQMTPNDVSNWLNIDVL